MKFADNIRNLHSLYAEASMAEFLQSDLSAEEFNIKKYKENFPCPQIVDGKMRIGPFIKLPSGCGNRQIKAEEVPKLYDEDLSLE